MSDPTYEVRVSGLVPIQQLLDEVRCLERARQEVNTVLSGRFADQAELHVVLRQLRAWGLEVVEVRRMPEDELPAAFDGVMALGEAQVAFGEAPL